MLQTSGIVEEIASLAEAGRDYTTREFANSMATELRRCRLVVRLREESLNERVGIELA